MAYDAGGELTRHGAWNLVYDAEGRIRQSTNTGTSQTTDYFYDGAGHRVKKTVGSASTWYVYDAFGQLAAEYTSSGPSGTAATHYITTDHLGSTRLVTDGSGAVVSRHDYLPFGEEAPSNLGGRSTSYGYLANASLTQRFTGKERDTETGLDYFGARYLSSPMGRFTSADAPLVDQHVSDPQSWNLYPYVRNNPLRYVDPDGNAVETLWDIANLGIGAYSMADNLVKGDIEAAIWDAGGLAVDLVATVIPFVPGGAGTAIKVARAATKAEKAATAAKAVRKVDKAKDAGKAADKGPSFLVSEGGDVIPVPKGATGPRSADNARGTVFEGGRGGPGLHPNVTEVRVMDPTPAMGKSPGYANGHVVYGNKAGQGVNPQTGQVVPKSDPSRHIPLSPPK